MASTPGERGETFQDKLEKIVTDMCTELGTGLTEAIYRNALATELQKISGSLFVVATEVAVPIIYKKQTVGSLRADITLSTPQGVVAIIELKVCAKLTDTHVEQCKAYMRRHPGSNGYVINFGVPGGEMHAIGTLCPRKKHRNTEIALSREDSENSADSSDEDESDSPPRKRKRAEPRDKTTAHDYKADDRGQAYPKMSSGLLHDYHHHNLHIKALDDGCLMLHGGQDDDRDYCQERCLNIRKILVKKGHAESEVESLIIGSQHAWALKEAKETLKMHVVREVTGMKMGEDRPKELTGKMVDVLFNHLVHHKVEAMNRRR